MYDIEVEIPSEYPVRWPSIEFKTRIWHPLVNDTDANRGQVCEDFIKEYWQVEDADRSLVGLLKLVRHQLATPHLVGKVHGWLPCDALLIGFWQIKA